MKTSTQHSRATRVAAVAVAANTTAAEAARALGVAPRTVQKWVSGWRAGELAEEDPALSADIEALATEFRRAAKVEMSRAVNLAAALLARELAGYLERPAHAPPLKPGELRDVAIVAGVLCDKLAAMGEDRPAGAPGRYVVDEDPLADDP